MYPSPLCVAKMCYHVGKLCMELIRTHPAETGKTNAQHMKEGELTIEFCPTFLFLSKFVERVSSARV